MNFLELAAKRYACKNYSDKPVEKEKLDAILEAGRLAPTAKNFQEQRIYVVQSAEALAKIDAETPCRYGASTVIVVAFDKNNMFTYPGDQYTSGKEDATIVATHMMLAAASLDVDNCWVNRFNPDVLAASLGLPKNEEIVMFLDLGYAKEGVGPLGNHFSRKPLEETVTYL
ncbi:MAG: nitroreductase family protein [Phascolarctobacterium sp.]|nr:nitroreductase family protein [Phascolarctobacterium sp.]